MNTTGLISDEIQIKDEVYEVEDAYELTSNGPEIEKLDMFSEADCKKCGEVLVGYHGNFTLVCTLCTRIFEDLLSFGLHIHSLHLKLSPPDGNSIKHNSPFSPTVQEIQPMSVPNIKVENDTEPDLPEETVYDVEESGMLHEDLDSKENKMDVIKTEENSHYNAPVESFIQVDNIGVNINGNVEESDCDNSLELNDKMLAHTTKMISELFCPICSACSKTNTAYDTHMKAMHSIDINTLEGLKSLSAITSDSLLPKVPKELLCKYCFETFNDPASCGSHMEKEHPLKLYTCPLCPKTFKRKESRNYHVDGHEGKKPYKCPYCPKAFTMPSNLKAHVNVHWNRKTKFACRLCDKKCSQKSNSTCRDHREERSLSSDTEGHIVNTDGNLLQDDHEVNFSLLKCEHPDGDEADPELNNTKRGDENVQIDGSISIHDNIQSEDSQTATSEQSCETFCCYSCGGIFMKMESYRKHYRNQHPDMIENDCSQSWCGHPSFVPKVPEEMLCKYCLKTFNDPPAYQNHMENAHPDKLYTCPHCPKSFSLKVDRNRHADVHEGKKHHKCPHCPKAFTSGANLKAHVVFIHMNIRSQFTCRFCDKKFQRNPDLKRHELIHTGEKKTPCNLCDLMFRDNRQLYRHMRKQHMNMKN